MSSRATDRLVSRLSILRVLALLLGGMAPAAAGAQLGAAPAAPPIVLDGQSVTTVTAPGANVVFFGAARVPLEYLSAVHLYSEMVAADADGVATLAPEAGVPFKSVWVIADVTTGGFAIATPEGFPLAEIAFPADTVGRGGGSALNQLQARFDWAWILYVRPTVGAWTLSVADATGNDLDGVDDGRIQTVIDQAQPVGASPAAPVEAQSGDVVVAVSPDTLQIFAARLL